MEIIIISGTSGAGKSIALNALADLGFYCVDNLPIRLLSILIDDLKQHDTDHTRRAAIGIDARSIHNNNSDPFAELTQTLQQHQPQNDLLIELIFLDADDTTLIKRFSETRRRHPLSDSQHALQEAIAQERKLLQPLRNAASQIIDTRRTHIHQLRELIQKIAGSNKANSQEGTTLLLESFGFKYGLPIDADFVFDARALPNPHWLPTLRPLTGQDAAVVHFLDQDPLARQFADDISTLIERWLPHFCRDRRSYLTVAIGCTGGQHRSVYLVERLHQHFAAGKMKILKRHREINPT
ncbi:MAG: RNase adapter RapZ [Gammaproteobacteria bacterium]|nr:RNase adapter RapZ [Gammaproteobacteria bacterium]